MDRYSVSEGESWKDQEGELVYYPDVREDIFKLHEIIINEYPSTDDRYILAEKIANEYLDP